jgi:hypothetical protein
VGSHPALEDRLYRGELALDFGGLAAQAPLRLPNPLQLDPLSSQLGLQVSPLFLPVLQSPHHRVKLLPELEVRLPLFSVVHRNKGFMPLYYLPKLFELLSVQHALVHLGGLLKGIAVVNYGPKLYLYFFIFVLFCIAL